MVFSINNLLSLNNLSKKSNFTHLLNQSKSKYKLLKLMISHLIHLLVLFLCLGIFIVIVIIIIIIIIIKLK